MEEDAQEKMEETKEDIDEVVHNPVSSVSSVAVSCALEHPDVDFSSRTRSREELSGMCTSRIAPLRQSIKGWLIMCSKVWDLSPA